MNWQARISRILAAVSLRMRRLIPRAKAAEGNANISPLRDLYNNQEQPHRQIATNRPLRSKFVPDWNLVIGKRALQTSRALNSPKRFAPKNSSGLEAGRDLLFVVTETHSRFDTREWDGRTRAMNDNDPDRLLTQIWKRRLIWIEDHLNRKSPIEPLLRHAFHLVQIAPLQLRSLISGAPDERLYEGILACEDWDRAIQLLLGDRLSVSRLTPTSGAMAVIVRDERASGSAIGATFPEAALGAWVARLLEAIDQGDTEV